MEVDEVKVHRIVVVETKGDQLAGNLDTEYKRELLKTLSDAFAGSVTSPLAQPSIDYQAAVVLFSEWQTKLPALISGKTTST